MNVRCPGAAAHPNYCRRLCCGLSPVLSRSGVLSRPDRRGLRPGMQRTCRASSSCVRAEGGTFSIWSQRYLRPPPSTSEAWMPNRVFSYILFIRVPVLNVFPTFSVLILSGSRSLQCEDRQCRDADEGFIPDAYPDFHRDFIITSVAASALRSAAASLRTYRPGPSFPARDRFFPGYAAAPAQLFRSASVTRSGGPVRQGQFIGEADIRNPASRPRIRTRSAHFSDCRVR